MSEKRFGEIEKHCYYTSLVFDNQTQEELGTPKVVVLLNMFEDDVQIKDKKIEEQQATIRRLQDLCGESDSENAKLRIENKKLQAKLREKEREERLYANEILELRETNKEHIKFKSLGGDY